VEGLKSLAEGSAPRAEAYLPTAMVAGALKASVGTLELESTWGCIELREHVTTSSATRRAFFFGQAGTAAQTDGCLSVSEAIS